jgi:hypothetical protein
MRTLPSATGPPGIWGGQTLRDLGPEASAAVGALCGFLRHPDGRVRHNAALALSGIGPAAPGAVRSPEQGTI